jgi:hypothetical protein
MLHEVDFADFPNGTFLASDRPISGSNLVRMDVPGEGVPGWGWYSWGSDENPTWVESLAILDGAVVQNNHDASGWGRVLTDLGVTSYDVDFEIGVTSGRMALVLSNAGDATGGNTDLAIALRHENNTAWIESDTTINLPAPSLVEHDNLRVRIDRATNKLFLFINGTVWGDAAGYDISTTPAGSRIGFNAHYAGSFPFLNTPLVYSVRAYAL